MALGQLETTKQEAWIFVNPRKLCHVCADDVIRAVISTIHYGASFKAVSGSEQAKASKELNTETMVRPRRINKHGEIKPRHSKLWSKFSCAKCFILKTGKENTNSTFNHKFDKKVKYKLHALNSNDMDWWGFALHVHR